jgi:hypothetical protein
MDGEGNDPFQGQQQLDYDLGLQRFELNSGTLAQKVFDGI